jgi:hypothetical protein
VTTLKWVKKHIDFAMKTDDLDEVTDRLRAIVTRLKISPLRESRHVTSCSEDGKHE